jgi:RecG-like helicase
VSSHGGRGEDIEQKLRALGIETIVDLLLHLPFRHEHPARVVDAGTLCIGEEATLRVHVLECVVR